MEVVLNTIVVPSSFDPKDSALEARTLPPGFVWKSLQDFLKERGSRGVLTRLPIFWQLEPAIHAACRSVQIPLCVVNPENLAINGAALEGVVSIDTVITSSSDLQIFVTHLTEHNIRLPKNWFIVHESRKLERTPEELVKNNIFVYEEAHTSPGEAIT